MLKTLLHKTLLTAITILLGVWAVVAQQYIAKGTALSFKADENMAIDFRWEILNVDAGSVINLFSETNITEEYTFNIEGNYEIKAYPVDKVSHCLGEPLVMKFKVTGELPTLVFDDLDSQVCSASRGFNPEAEIACTVHYTGPLPWTFKYSIDSKPSKIPEGADEIWTKSFDFVVTIQNKTGRILSSDIMIVEAMSFSGLKVVEEKDKHLKKIRILPLPDTKFIDFDDTAMATGLQSFSANILRNDIHTYQLIVPDGATLLNENTRLLADGFHSELTFDIQWGTELGPKQVKLIEKTIFGCFGDTICANVNIVESINFTLNLKDKINACINDELILDPKPNFIDNRKYKYRWSTGDTGSTIRVRESGIYSVEVRDNFGLINKDTCIVTFNPLPIVDLGPDRNIPKGESTILDPGDSGVNAIYKWSNDESIQSIRVSNEDKYWVQVTDNNGCVGSDTIFLTNDAILSVELDDFVEICEGVNTYLNPIVTGDDVTYNWIPGGETESGIYVSKKGKYCVQVSDKRGRNETACIEVIINPAPIVELGGDIKLEIGETAELDAGNDGVSYMWSTNEISSKIEVSSTGKYSVEVMDIDNCVGRDSVNVFSKGRRYLPSGFSPNRDGRNDILFVKKYDNVKAMTFIIYNRGGQKIFQSNRFDIGWDGTYKGEMQKMDTYVYFFKATLDNNKTEVQMGEVTLLR